MYIFDIMCCGNKFISIIGRNAEANDFCLYDTCVSNRDNENIVVANRHNNLIDNSFKI